MEVTGLAVGVVGLAGLFSVCLDSLSRFQTYRESNSETHVLDTRFRAVRARFEQWGVSVGISNGRLQPDHHRGLDNKETANLIESILQIIAKTICDESILQRSRTRPRSQSGQLGSLSQSRGKRLKWALGGKESRHEQVDIFEKLVQQLHNLIPPEEKGHNYGELESTVWVEDIRQMLTKIEEGIKSEIQRDVLSWLGKSATNDKYEDSLAKRVDTTCEWIFERPTFRSWLSPSDPTRPGVLWIKGPAGFGKTILSAHIVHRLSQTLDTPVAHFFFTSDHESREDPFAALRSWHRQVAAKTNAAFECIRRVWENDSSEQASRKTLVDLFKQMITAVPGCVFIADGLDECSQLGSGDASVARFLRDIMGAVAGTDARLLLVSRDEPEIRKALGDQKETLSEYRIGTNDVQADTSAYSQSVVDRKLRGKSEDLRLAISKSMSEKCQGQFLWIKLQEQSLRNTMSKKRLHEVVENTPSGLDCLYDQNWSRIMRMLDQDRDWTFALLRWTAFTSFPLPIYQLVEAVLMDQYGELDPDECPEDIDDQYISGEIQGLCGPFVEVHDNEKDPSPELRTLHMPHFSVRQYLVQHLPAPLWMQPKDMMDIEGEMIHHTAIARACVQYLSLSEVWEEDNDPYLRSKFFLMYSAFFWAKHAKRGFMDPSLRDLSKAFLKSNNICFNSLLNFLAQSQGSSSALMFQQQLRPFEYMLYEGWIRMAEILIEDADINEVGALGRSAIFAACVSGSAESVKMLIRRGAHLNTTDIDGLTCLHEAAFRGFEEIVRMLVESNIDLSSQTKNGMTPLHFAARGGNMKCYQYLLAQGADASVRDMNGSSVVHHTCVHAGHAELLRFILQNGPNGLATDHAYKTGSPLLLVAGNGDIDMANVLFEFGASSSLFGTEFNGEMPLQHASSSGHVELVASFLEHGAERTLSTANKAGNTALHLACTVPGHDSMISLLLRPGVEESILKENKEGDTPLHVASRAGHASYVKLILQYSEPGHQRLLEMKNNKLETPLCLASSLGNFAVVRELLSFKAQTTFSVSNEAHRTPLFIAAYIGHAEIVKALLEYGAEDTLDMFDVCDDSPLWAASVGGSSEVVKELLSHGAGRTITASNSRGETPLHVAVITSVELMKLLLEVPGVSVNQKTTYGFSPLFIASRNGYLSMVELLLSVDSVDQDSENWLGLGPLFAAVANGHLEVTKLLLSKGCHAQHQVSIGRDLLWWAQRSNTPDLIQLLQTQEPLDGTASDSCSALPGIFTNLESLSRDAETVHCTPDLLIQYPFLVFLKQFHKSSDRNIDETLRFLADRVFYFLIDRLSLPCPRQKRFVRPNRFKTLRPVNTSCLECARPAPRQQS
ncbi:ankyrin [Fusarium pseudocircinatum]|uniref:Ankyrin n=1 Tax=Fusarium pseudocircinatum TaxID=56676 RepID=A0A8H5PUZ9_9HYPO|nr:ankyrin [Fusarium pseudocircinatum]